MLEVPVYNTSGEKIDTLQVDEAKLGGRVNPDLIKQAVVTYHANRRQGSAQTRSRADVVGSRKKMYRQKGTGNARHGTRQAPILRGGGHTFAKKPRDFSKKLPQKMRRAARNSAILAKIVGEDILVVDGLSFEAPKTSAMSAIVKALGINRSCVFAIAERDSNIYLSSRNIKDITVRITDELNAYDVATRQKMLVTREAMEALVG
jgi:large subunit ribosomal protein L4